jgi:hypothetical protein
MVQLSEKLIDMENLFYQVSSMIFHGSLNFSGFYYFRTSVEGRLAQLQCPFTVAGMVTHDLLWIRGS